jgi:hypothetical protein
VQVIHFIYATLLFPVLFLYLASFVTLIRHLRSYYPTIWTSLGAPHFSADWARVDPVAFASCFLRVLRFVFSNQTVLIRDRQLSTLVWLVRVSLISFATLFTAVIATGLVRAR